MIKDITFARPQHFLGRNGYFNANGISISNDAHNNTVDLEPLTSRNEIGQAILEIPVEDVPSVIEALRKAARLPADDSVTITRAQWDRIKTLIDHAIQFGEQQPGVADTHRFTLVNLLEREAEVKGFVPA